MQDKLQELTDKLYNEGLSKGKKDAEDMLAKAKSEAAGITAEAKEEAQKIIADAKREGEELKKKAEGDIRMASSQALTAVRQKIEQAIIVKSVETPVTEALGEKEFMSALIKTVVSAFNPKESSQSLEVILPENKKQELDSFVKNELSKCCSSGIHVIYDRNIENGFKVGPKGKGYTISFTDKSFESLISSYLRPKTKKLLFGE